MTPPIGAARAGAVARRDAIPDEMVDNFESADSAPLGVYEAGETIADYYTGDTGVYSRVQSSTDAYEGDFYLQVTGTGADIIESHPGDGLNRYPSRGDTITFAYLGNGFGTADPPIDGPIWSKESGAANYYWLQIDGNDDVLNLFRNDDGSGLTSLDSSAATYTDDQWYVGEIDFDSANNGTISATLYDASDESTVASVSVSNETTHSNDGVGVRTAIFGGTDRNRRFDKIRAGNISAFD